MSCRGCIYRAAPFAGYKCDYLLLTGRSRGCPIEGCTKRETEGTPWRTRPRPVTLPGSLPPDKLGSRTPLHQARAEQPAVRLSFDGNKALNLYLAGKSDREIAGALGGVTKNCIRAWRQRRGLPGNWKGRPRK